MRRFILMGLVAVSATTVWAQGSTTDQNTNQASNQNAPVSETGMATPSTGGLKDEAIGLRPQVGDLNFKDADGNSTNRGAIGLAYDMNFSRIVAGVANNIYAGISTGGLYSHLGDPGSNFFGSSSSTPIGTGGSYMLLFPVNAKIGYNFTDSLRVSAHGGGNVMYNSIPGSIAPELGSDVSRNWNIFPNVGGDVDFGLTRNVALTLRPDWTFTPGVGFFTGTLELGIALG